MKTPVPILNLLRRLRSTALVFLGLTLSVSAGAQEISFSHQFTTEDGLADRSVKKVLRDHDGKFWIFTDYSIQLFDGRNFETISTPENFSPSQCRQIELLEDDRIALISDTDTSYTLDTYRYGFSKIKKEDSAKNDQLFVSEARLFSVFKLKDQVEISGEFSTTPEVVLSDVSLPIMSLDFYAGDRLSILERDGDLKLFQGGRLLCKQRLVADYLGVVNGRVLFLKDSIVNSIDRYCVSSIVVNHKAARVILRKDENGSALLCLGNTSNTDFFRSAILIDSAKVMDYSFLLTRDTTLTDVFSEDFTEEVLVGTHEGLTYTNINSHIENYLRDDQRKEGKYGYVVRWVIERERDSTIYFALNSIGLFRVDDKAFLQILPNGANPEAFRGNEFGFYHRPHDLLLGMSESNGRFQLNLYQFNTLVEMIDIGHYFYEMVGYDEDHILMVGFDTEGQGVVAALYMNQGNRINYSSIPQMKGVIKAIHKSGDIYYLGGADGLFQMKITISDERIRFSEIKKIHDESTRDLYVNESHLLVGTEEEGLYIMQNGKIIKQLKTDNGLADDKVISIGEDASGNFWIASFKGVTVLDSKFNIICVIDRSDGLASTELNTHAIHCDNDGNVYLGTINGLSKISPLFLKRAISRSSYLVEGFDFEVSDRRVSDIPIVQNQLQVPYGVGNISVRIKEYDYFKSPLKRHMIFENHFDRESGLDTKFTGDILHIDNIKSGTEIITWKTSDLSQPLIINKTSFLAHYRLLLFLTAISGILIYFLLRIQRKRKSEERQKVLAQTEAKVASSRLLALRTQMNPHFIYNSLGSIQYYIQQQNTDFAEEYLADFAQLMRMILESSKKDAVTIEEEIGMLKLYLKLEHLRFDQKFDYRFEIDDSVDMEMGIVPMAIQPFIENAINHGLYHLLSRRGELIIKFEALGEDEMRCQVMDNGVGRKLATQLRSSKHESRAMQIVKERIDLLSSINAQSFRIEIEDLFSNGDPAGTIVSLYFKEEISQ